MNRSVRQFSALGQSFRTISLNIRVDQSFNTWHTVLMPEAHINDVRSQPVARAADEVLRWCRAWTASVVAPTRVRLSAGSDREIDVDGLDQADIDAVLAAARPAVSESCSSMSGELRAHLVEVGALVPDLMSPGRSVVPEVFVVSEAAAPVADAIRTALAGRSSESDDGAPGVGSDPSAPFDVVLRCGPGTRVPHPGRVRLIVDVGAEHTVVIGPLVVPGASACEQCLDTRLARRWEPATQPERPAVTELAALLAELVVRHVDLVNAGTSPVVNATIATDIVTMTARRDPLLMSPGCAICGVTAPSSRPRLPWEEA